MSKKMFEKNEKFKKKVQKIMVTREEKRDFLPLFNCQKPKIFSEEDRKNYMYEIARKYFEVKKKILEKEEII